MKTRLNLTIEESLLQRMKAYAAKKHVSLSELVETYFERLAQSAKPNSIISLVENMDIPYIEGTRDLIEEYNIDMGKKYGK